MRTAIISVALTAVMVSATALADKPEWAGKGGKPTAEQKAAHKDAMNAKQGKGGELEEGEQQKKEKNREEKHYREKDEAKEKAGKQQSDKAERERKELGKGSEDGQASRENRKKWWKVWGE